MTGLGLGGLIEALPVAKKQQTRLDRLFPSAPVTERLALATGCNNVASTWPDGTALAQIAAAVQPPEALRAIWRFDPAAGRALGFAPGAAAASNLQAARWFDALFVCIGSAATIARPRLTP